MEDQSWEQTYPGQTVIISALRRDIRAVLAKAGCPEMVADVVMSGMSELGANAVVHTPSGWQGGVFVARVFMYVGTRHGSYVWAEVENDGVTHLNLSEVPPRHGLDITRRMVTRMGTERGVRGRVVYFIVRFDPDTGEIAGRSPRLPDAVPLRI